MTSEVAKLQTELIARNDELLGEAVRANDTADFERIHTEQLGLIAKAENWLDFIEIIDEPERKRRETNDALETVTIRSLRELRLALHLRRDILAFDRLLESDDLSMAQASTQTLLEITDLAIHRYQFDIPFDEEIDARILSFSEYIELLKKVFGFARAFSEHIDTEEIFRYRPLQRVFEIDLFGYLICEIKIVSWLDEKMWMVLA